MAVTKDMDLLKMNKELRDNADKIRMQTEFDERERKRLARMQPIDLVLMTEDAKEDIVQSIRRQFAEKKYISWKQKAVLANWVFKNKN